MHWLNAAHDGVLVRKIKKKKEKKKKRKEKEKKKRKKRKWKYSIKLWVVTLKNTTEPISAN